MPNRDRHISRRKALQTTAALGVTGVLAGCLGGDDNGDDGDDGNGDDANGDDANGEEATPWGDVITSTPEIIIPYGPGGGTDTYARAFQGPMRELADQTIEISNVPGAATFNGVGQMLQAEPDGLTVAIVNLPATALNDLVQEPDLPVQDMVPMAQFAVDPLVWCANPDEGLRHDPEEMIARFEDGTYTATGGVGPGTPETHAIAARNVGIPWEDYIRYDGTGNAIQAIASGEISVGLPSMGGALGPIEEGTIEPVMMATGIQSSALPDVPLFTDVFDQDITFVSQVTRGFYAPPGTPDEVVDAWEALIRETLEHPETVEWQEDTGQDITYGDRDVLGDVFFGMYEDLPDLVDLSEFDN